MRPVFIELKRPVEHYDIVIGHDHLKNLGGHLQKFNPGSTAVVITNPEIWRYHGKSLMDGLRDHALRWDVIEIPAGESSKSAQTAFEVIHRIADTHVSQDICIVALGGGVVGDLAGYVAAAYKRGIPYVQVPTTLLAQIDSAIGGKVAIDLPFGKNLVGAFYHPRLVFTDVAVLETLDERQVRSGLAEAIKYGVICDKNLFHLIERNLDDLLALESRILTQVVEQCSRIKAGIVSRDEKETGGVRTILNFGHTTGHAIETVCAYESYNHGEAVALGMRVAADISLKMGMVKEGDVVALNDVLTRAGLPERMPGLSADRILEFMKYDKKFRAGQNRFVLMTAIGSVKVRQNIDETIIREALERFCVPAAPPPSAEYLSLEKDSSVIDAESDSESTLF